jgi:bifunctional non-homologous end joining protein LigD
MLSRLRALPAGFTAPCLPINAPQPPSGEQWLHEIKHDGFRIIARKDGKRVKLYSRSGNDLTCRFSLIVEAIAKLRSRSCIIDGEAVACGEDGIASFDRIRYRHNDDGVFLYAFDLIELDGDDLRRNPLIVRKTTLASVLARAAPGLRLNEHLEADARMSSITPASWASKVSSRSARTRDIDPVGRQIGSRARTPMLWR